MIGIRTPGLAGTVLATPRSPEIDRCDLFQISSFRFIKNTGCSFDTGQTCVSKLTVYAVISNEEGNVTYNWTSSVPGPASITEIGGFTNQAYEVWITADADTTVTLTCQATDTVGVTPVYDGDVVVTHQLNL